MTGPEPGMRVTDVPPRSDRIVGSPPGLSLTPPEPPPARCMVEDPRPVGDDGFTPVRELKNLFVPPADPGLWR